MVVVLALVAALLAPLAPPVGSCADVQLIGVRGSGQSGYGEQVEAVVDEVVPALRGVGRMVSVETLDYPAISISDSFGLVLLTGDYDRSVAKGVDGLHERLDTLASTCPLTDVVLVGYSQGAQVIKVALEDATPRHRVAAVALLADPTRSIAERVLRRLGDVSVVRDGAFGAIELPDHLRSVSVDVCAAGDGVCDRDRRDLRAHVDGYTPLAADVATAIVAELEDGAVRYRTPR